MPDSDAARSRFLNLMKTDVIARARYTPLSNQSAQVAREKVLRQTEASNRAVAAQINEGHNLRFGKTERSTQFSAFHQQLYNKALIAYQAQDSQEFADAFRQGKLLNLETFVNKMDVATKCKSTKTLVLPAKPIGEKLILEGIPMGLRALTGEQ